MADLHHGGLRIGLLAERTGTSAPTIRFYEEIGLMPKAGRQEGGQRRYGKHDVQRLQLIKRCRDFGFSIEQVRSLMALYDDPDSSCAEARDVAHEHLRSVRQKITELRALEKNISQLVEQCETSCAGGPGPRCTVFDDTPAKVHRKTRARKINNKTRKPT